MHLTKDSAVAIATILPVIYVAYIVAPLSVTKHVKAERRLAVILASLIGLIEILMIVVINFNGLAVELGGLIVIIATLTIVLILMFGSIAYRTYKKVDQQPDSQAATSAPITSARAALPAGVTEVVVHPASGPHVVVSLPSTITADVRVTVN